MDSIDMGPEWFWKLLFFLGAIGFIALIIWTIQGIIWLFNHVKIDI